MYTLRVGNVYLAPRKSIRIEESSDFERLVDESQRSDCGTACTNSSRREFGFKIHFIGNGSLESAWSLYRTLTSELDLACDSQKLLRRRVQDEAWLEYQISGGTTRMVDVINQYTCQRILTIELILKLKAVDGIQPLVVHVTIPQPTVSMTNSVSVSPEAVTVTIPTPSVTLSASVSPLPIVVTKVTPTDPPPPP